MCFIPDDDLFEAINQAARPSVVTDHDRHASKADERACSILASLLKADIIVTATGTASWPWQARLP